jgi:hypothetical protein
MDENKGWLEKVLNDASAEVKSWPNWLKDRESEDQEKTEEAHRASASGSESHHKAKNQQSFD